MSLNIYEFYKTTVPGMHISNAKGARMHILCIARLNTSLPKQTVPQRTKFKMSGDQSDARGSPIPTNQRLLSQIKALIDFGEQNAKYCIGFIYAYVFNKA